MTTTHEQRYRAVRARDARFDGVFYTGVRTTGIYCRPSCPAVTPRATNVDFYVSPAAAQAAGLRACRRCRPDTTPGSPEWDVRGDLVGRAMRLIRDGVVEREGVEGLATRLGYTPRHVGRVLSDELGAGPLALARSARAQTARLLIETTSLPLADVAFAAGFSSVRQFNDTVREVYATTPSALRRSSRAAGDRPPGRLSVRLAVRRPFAADALRAFLAGHAVPGLEVVDGPTYARVLDLPHGHGVVELDLFDDHVDCRLELTDLRDTATAVDRCRRLLDLDADPIAIDEILGDLVTVPGLRVPGSVDAVETAVRTIVGQQVSVAGAQTVTARLVRALGAPVGLPGAAARGLTHAFPTPAALADLDPATAGMPAARARAIVALARAVGTEGIDLGPGADRAAARADLLALPGIGPWTADYVLMRGLGDPDVLLGTDLVLRREIVARGLSASDTTAWSPWRSYAGMHLWGAAAARRTDEG